VGAAAAAMTSSNSEGASFGNSSVEYFLLEPPNSRNNSGSRRARTGGIAAEDGEILSPISHAREEAITINNNNNSERIYFNEDGDADEEELTLPSTTQHLLLNTADTPATRPRLRSSFSGRALRTELSGLNYLNVTCYLAHVFVWYGIAVYGLLGQHTTRWYRTEQYETLVTPTNWSANYLWIPILLTQGVFAVAQLVPYYRNRPIVTTGTGYFFFYTVLLQIAYTFLYSFGLFIFSFVAVVLTAVALLSLLVSQHHQYHHNGNSRVAGSHWEYLLFRLPFFLHAGWIILMTVDHFSLLFRRYSGDTAIQLAVDIVSLAVLLPVAVTALTQAYDFVIPIVMLWSYVSSYA